MSNWICFSQFHFFEYYRSINLKINLLNKIKLQLNNSSEIIKLLGYVYIESIEREGGREGKREKEREREREREIKRFCKS